MRGVCALIVMVMHCDLALNTGHLLNHGWLSVDVFFVLSGFVIAYTYEDRLRDGFAFTQFVRARARRLIPVQMIGTALATLAAMLAVHHVDPTALGLAGIFGMLLIPVALTPLRSVFSSVDLAFPTNLVLWSLEAEWLANLVYARWLFARSGRILAGVAGLLAVPLIVHALSYTFGWSLGVRPGDLAWGLLRGTVEFLIGVMLFRLQGRLAKLPSVRPELVYAIWFAVACVPMPHVMPLFEAGASLILAPFLIALLIRSDRPVPRGLVWLGALSYPLYASHFAIINLASLAFDPAVARHSPLFVFPMAAAALALAWRMERMIPARLPVRLAPAPTEV
jgi:peptidoglycan/LPS O-acetylase OafA/YrhL